MIVKLKINIIGIIKKKGGGTYHSCALLLKIKKECICCLAVLTDNSNMFSVVQVALRRQQAQEEELGICSPVPLSGAGMMVKNEAGAECFYSAEGRNQAATSTSSPTVVPGET